MKKVNRQKKRRLRRRIQMVCRLIILVLIVFGVFQIGKYVFHWPIFGDGYIERTGEEIDALRPELDVELLTINAYSRPALRSERIRNIVIHYTANPGTTAMQNRNYFEGLKDSHVTKASSHFIIGLEGEIVQCIPTAEISYATNHRNSDTISIETCHWKESGAYTDETYQSMVELTAWLCVKFDLTEQDVIRHYDVTGKICPKYFVDHEDAWETFKQDVGKRIDEM